MFVGTGDTQQPRPLFPSFLLVAYFPHHKEALFQPHLLGLLLIYNNLDKKYKKKAI